jgi:hypothetical protein
MSPEEFPEEERWVDDEAGPVVRPYVMTYGRTQPTRGRFDLISLVVSIRRPPAAEAGLHPEHIKIIRLCRDPMSVAEIAAHLDLPAGTIRVLIGDLLDRRYVEVQAPPAPRPNMHDEQLYKAVLDGLRAL